MKMQHTTISHKRSGGQNSLETEHDADSQDLQLRRRGSNNGNVVTERPRFNEVRPGKNKLGDYDENVQSIAENHSFIRRNQFFAEAKRRFEQSNLESERKEKQKIQELQQFIRQEIKAFRQMQDELNGEIARLHALVLEEKSTASGIYDVGFLELVIHMLKNLRAKVGESRTWMQAMVSRKKKRGSLFAAQSKQKGTSYSLSQEISLARNTG